MQMRSANNQHRYGMERPCQSADLLAADSPHLILKPIPELSVWVQDTILAGTGPLHNPDHAHLLYADIGFLWASSAFAKRGRTVVGQAEQVMIRAGGWPPSGAFRQTQ